MKDFEYYLEQANLVNESHMGNVVKATFIVGGILGAFGVARNQSNEIVQEFEQDKEVKFKHGKHNITVRTGGLDDIIYTSKGNQIIILVPETMDKDIALQKVEEIVMDVKQKDNIKE